MSIISQHTATFQSVSFIQFDGGDFSVSLRGLFTDLNMWSGVHHSFLAPSKLRYQEKFPLFFPMSLPTELEFQK